MICLTIDQEIKKNGAVAINCSNGSSALLK